MQGTEAVEGFPFKQLVGLKSHRQYVSVLSKLLFEREIGLILGMVGWYGSAEVVTHFDLGSIICHDAGNGNNTQKQGEAIAQYGFTNFLPHISYVSIRSQRNVI